jgi:hypothetical protein
MLLVSRAQADVPENKSTFRLRLLAITRSFQNSTSNSIANASTREALN